MIFNNYIINININKYLNRIEYFINLSLNIYYIIKIFYY